VRNNIILYAVQKLDIFPEFSFYGVVLPEPLVGRWRVESVQCRTIWHIVRQRDGHYRSYVSNSVFFRVAKTFPTI